MLTETALRHQAEGRRVQGGGPGRHVRHRVSLGTITFRLDYRLNGRRETFTMGRYGS